jgi:NAD-dependent dihydropyrimidine dehydrogenase PreA subunit
MKDLVYLEDVVTLELNADACNGCSMCLKVCPHDVFELYGKKAIIARRNLCMECGACAINCPQNAISVNSGVGCAAGIINGILKNSEPTCGCSDSGSSCC